MIEACDGSVSGALRVARVKRRPPAASAIECRRQARRALPKAPTRSARSVSMVISRTLQPRQRARGQRWRRRPPPQPATGQTASDRRRLAKPLKNDRARRAARVRRDPRLRGARSRPMARHRAAGNARADPQGAFESPPPRGVLDDDFSRETALQPLERGVISARRKDAVVVAARPVDEPLQQLLKAQRRFRRAVAREVPAAADIAEPAAGADRPHFHDMHDRTAGQHRRRRLRAACGCSGRWRRRRRRRSSRPPARGG